MKRRRRAASAARRRETGFTLIEVLVALGFAAVATLSILALVRSSLQMLGASQNMALAAQMAVSPGMAAADPAPRLRQVREEELDLGPMKLRSVLMEMVKDGRDQNVRIRVYR